MATDGESQPHLLIVGSVPEIICTLAERCVRRGASVSVVLEPGSESAADILIQTFPSRVQVLAGGSSRIDFGLSGSSYRELAERVTAVVDLDPLGAGPGGFVTPPVAVPGRELVELARVSRHGLRIVALSSVMVAGNFKGVFAEHDVAPAGAVRDPFAAWLAHKERILRRFAAALPVDIVRAGWVVGDRPGLCPLVPLLFGLDEHGLEAVAGQFIPLVSLDSLLGLVEQRVFQVDTRDSQVFHLFEREVAPVELLHAQLARLAKEFAPRAFDLARGAQRVLTGEALHGWELESFWRLHPQRTQFSERATVRYLEANSLSPPRIDDDTWRQLVSNSVEQMGGFR